MIYKCNSCEYVGPESRTRKAYHKLIFLRNQLTWKQINFNQFIVSVEKVIFNDIPQKDLIYLNDGIKNGCYVTILKLLTAGSDDSINRLKTDLLTVY